MSATPEPRDSVATNYNDAGSIIMERIYGEHYLSPGATTTTALLASLSGLNRTDSVLDVGSGLGGPACFLAQRFGSRVQGVDLVPANVNEANRRAEKAVLPVSFLCGDATALPFENQSFTLVFGQDAWCHVDDKAKMLIEYARVLRPGGKLVFSDWLLAEAPNANNEEIRRVAASPNMGSVGVYHGLLVDQGFRLSHYINTSSELTGRYAGVIATLVSLRGELCERFSQKVYEIVLAKQQRVLHAFESGQLETGCFVAQSPGG